jgi:hypothetical protein
MANVVNRSTPLRIAVVIAISVIFFYNSSVAQTIPKQDHQISLTDAKRYIENYSKNPTVPTIKGGFFWRAIFDKILEQPGCVGITIYYAKTDEGEPTFVIIGVNDQEKEITEGIIGQVVLPCPPYCTTESILTK